jgi:hypothetical protein
MRVPDAHAVPERSHLERIRDFASHLFDHETCPSVVGSENVLKSRDVVPLSPTPRNAAEVDPIVDPVIREWREIFLVNGIPETQLCGDPTIEVTEDIYAVSPFRCRREPEQLNRLEMLEKSFV